jgi:hypothetical protein
VHAVTVLDTIARPDFRTTSGTRRRQGLNDNALCMHADGAG